MPTDRKTTRGVGGEGAWRAQRDARGTAKVACACVESAEARGSAKTVWIGSAKTVEKRENDETRAFKWVKLYEKRAQTWLRKAPAARLPGNPAAPATVENAGLTVYAS